MSACLAFSGEFSSPAPAAMPLWGTHRMKVTGFGRGRMLPTNCVCCLLISLTMCVCWTISALGCLSLETLTAIFYSSTLFCSVVPSLRLFLFQPSPCSFPSWAPSSPHSFEKGENNSWGMADTSFAQTLITTRGHYEPCTRYPPYGPGGAIVTRVTVQCCPGDHHLESVFPTAAL